MRWLDRRPPTPRALFLAWQDPASRRWYPIGRLERDDAGFRFSYTQGFLIAREQAGLPVLIGFPDAHRLYESEVLFPFFRNRVMNPSRPGLPQYLESLDLVEDADPVAQLARSGGRRSTDAFKLYPAPEPTIGDDGERLYDVTFFAHGLAQLPAPLREHARGLGRGARLRPLWDYLNEHDENAVALETDDRWPVGYVPRYHSPTLLALRELSVPIHLAVARANAAPAPWARAVLCRGVARWPVGFQPMGDEAHQPLVCSSDSREAMSGG